MKKNMFKKFLFSSSFFFVSIPLYAQNIPSNLDLNKAFASQDYALASNIAQDHPSPQNTEILSRWANQGSVPAMWLYARQLYNDGKGQDSANWVYTAVLGLRLDVSSCTNNEVAQVEKDFFNAYWSVIQAARVMPIRMATAIDFSIQFFKKNNLKTIDPIWVCHFKPAWNHQELLLREPAFSIHRQWIYKDYIQSSSAHNQIDEESVPLTSSDIMKALQESESTSH